MVASRLFIDAAASPPHEEGNAAHPTTSNPFTRSKAAYLVASIDSVVAFAFHLQGSISKDSGLYPYGTSAVRVGKDSRMSIRDLEAGCESSTQGTPLAWF